MLRGLKVTDEDKLEDMSESLVFRKRGLNPVLEDRLSWRKEEAKDEIGDDYLPFSNRTFVIGPMIVNKDVFNKSEGPTLEEDTKASNLFVGKSIAVDRQTILELLGKNASDKVTNGEVVEALEKIIYGK